MECLKHDTTGFRAQAKPARFSFCCLPACHASMRSLIDVYGILLIYLPAAARSRHTRRTDVGESAKSPAAVVCSAFTALKEISHEKIILKDLLLLLLHLCLFS